MRAQTGAGPAAALDQALAAAETRLAAGDFEEAARPRASYFHHLGRAQLAAGRATEPVSRALELDPRVPGARTTLGYIHLQQGRPSEAEEALRAELASRSGDVRSQRLLAAALAVQGRTEEAVARLRAILDARPDAAQVHLELGKACERLGRTQLADEQFEAYRRLTEKR